MNILLSALQILLSVHTLIGALWKFSNSEQLASSLAAIPQSAWIPINIVELLCSVALVLPLASKRFAILAPIAAACIGVEMLLFCGINLISGQPDYSEITYWLVVAAICAFIIYGRRVRKTVLQTA
jgi:hypothetical protein